MARQDQTRKTVRAQTERAAVEPGRTTQGVVSTRYVNVRGSSDAALAAEALKDSFGIGAKAFQVHDQKMDIAGNEQAVKEAASGGTRDYKNKNDGYMQAWSKLDAITDWNGTEAEIDQILQENDWLNKPAEEVDKIIENMYAGEFAGAQDDAVYARTLLPKMMEYKANAMALHAQTQVDNQNIAHETNLNQALRKSFKDTGVWDYGMLDEMSDDLKEGSEVTELYASILFSAAKELGRPDLIENMPDAYRSGQPTIKDQPAWAERKATALSAAYSTALAKQDAAEKARDKYNKDQLHGVTMTAVTRLIDDPSADISTEIRMASSNPEAKYTDIIALEGFQDKQRDEGYKFASSAKVVAGVWADIYAGRMDASGILQALGDGRLGDWNDPSTAGLAHSMMAAIESVHTSSRSGNSRQISEDRAAIQRQYNPQLGGMLAALDTDMQNINIQANTMYDQLIHDNTPPWEARLQVFEKFDAVVERVKPAGKGSVEMESYKGQIITLNGHIVQQFIAGAISPEHFYGKHDAAAMDLQLLALIEKGEVTAEQFALLDNLIN